MSDTHYSFVSTPEDVDFQRIIDESPTNTAILLVEHKLRNGEPVCWDLFTNISLEYHKTTNQLHELIGAEDSDYMAFNTSDGIDWYLVISIPGKAPGWVKQGIEKIRAELNPKNLVTRVTLV
jgi:hypothetical protein